MNNTLAAIVAMGVMAFSGCEEETKLKQAMHQPVDVLVIAENECKEVCGGEICYEDVAYTPQNKTEIGKYAISIGGFDSIEFIGRKFILADECIFYRKSAGKELVLERLR